MQILEARAINYLQLIDSRAKLVLQSQSSVKIIVGGFEASSWKFYTVEVSSVRVSTTQDARFMHVWISELKVCRFLPLASGARGVTGQDDEAPSLGTKQKLRGLLCCVFTRQLALDSYK